MSHGPNCKHAVVFPQMGGRFKGVWGSFKGFGDDIRQASGFYSHRLYVLAVSTKYRDSFQEKSKVGL